jgi:hypothetical protein
MAEWISKQAKAAQAWAGNTAGGAVNAFGNGVANAGAGVGNKYVSEALACTSPSSSV